MIYLLLIPAALWGALWWRLRGGAFTTMTGIDPGTGGMRAIAAVGIVAPLAGCLWWLPLSPWWLLLIPAFWIGWSLAGWGAFQGMGKEAYIEMKNPVARLLSYQLADVAHFKVLDLLGMAIEGVYTLIFPAAAAVVSTGHYLTALVCLVGMLFAPTYYAAQWASWRPDWGKFAKAGSEWAEVLVGAIVAGAFAAVVIRTFLQG